MKRGREGERKKMDTCNGVGYPAKLEILARAVPQEWFFGSMPFQYAFVSRARADKIAQKSSIHEGNVDGIIGFYFVERDTLPGREGEEKKRDETSSTSMRNFDVVPFSGLASILW